ncbi:hypothetical protein [Klebsiella quasipneumoniae]|uniref:hypothetical protein n=1 Tax=Klebsiella quasipneumoniae TaxID=1463165 RepID=UPI0012B8BA48|nr:hypothetical protein [Klebsiella quasipneumoniae]
MEGVKEKGLTPTLNNVKKYLIYALKISPIYMVLSVIIVWGYLGHFSRLDLLVGAIENKTNLFSIFFSFIFISLFMSFAFILPSFNLILFSSFVKDSYITSTKNMPFITFITIVVMLASVFIFSSAVFSSFVKNYSYIDKVFFYLDEPLRSLLLSFIASIVSVVAIAKVKNSHKNRFSGSAKIIRISASIIITSIICFLSSISISISISLVLKSIDGHTFFGYVYAFLFLSAYSFLSLFPAMIFYSRNYSFNNVGVFSYKVMKETSLAIMGSLFFIVCIWPNGFLFIGSTALSTIGVLDKRVHYYHITSEKYYKELFPATIWETKYLEGRRDFFIKAVNMFSFNGNNLVCPVYVESLRKKTLVSSFDNFSRQKDKYLNNHFKTMAKGCVVLTSDEFKQWDTIMDAKGNFKI